MHQNRNRRGGDVIVDQAGARDGGGMRLVISSAASITRVFLGSQFDRGDPDRRQFSRKSLRELAPMM